MRKYTIISVFLFLVVISGCALLEPTTDEAGVSHTQLGDTMVTIGKAAGSIGGFVPGLGTLIAGIGSIVGLIGGGITSVMATRKRGKALDTVIVGVERASETYNVSKDVLLRELRDKISSDDYNKISSMIDKIESVKEAISRISGLIGNNRFIDKRVQKITS